MTSPQIGGRDTVRSRRRRIPVLAVAVALAGPLHLRAQVSIPAVPSATHDFDFEIGAWTVANSRLMRRPDGSTEWIHFSGTSVARPVWGGRGDVVELESDAPYGHSTGLIVRLFDPRRRRWHITFASAADGELGPPLIGSFTGRRGEFTGADEIDGTPVRVRHVLSNISPTTYRLEQSISRDGGKSWTLNWISEHTRAPR